MLKKLVEEKDKKEKENTPSFQPNINKKIKNIRNKENF